MNLDLNNPEEIKKYVKEALKDSEMRYLHMKAMYDLAVVLNEMLPDDDDRNKEIQALTDELNRFKIRIDTLKQLGDLIVKLMESGSTMTIPYITKESDVKWN